MCFLMILLLFSTIYELQYESVCHLHILMQGKMHVHIPNNLYVSEQFITTILAVWNWVHITRILTSTSQECPYWKDFYLCYQLPSVFSICMSIFHSYNVACMGVSWEVFHSWSTFSNKLKTFFPNANPLTLET